MAFHGTFEHTLDAKNRVTVPAKFRPALAGRVFLVRNGEDPCISVYPEATYQALAQAALARLNPLSRKAKEAKRLFYAYADDIELDGAGRITLAAKHLQYARIDSREVVIAGAGDSLELWSPRAWRDYDSDLTARAADVTSALEPAP